MKPITRLQPKAARSQTKATLKRPTPIRRGVIPKSAHDPRTTIKVPDYRKRHPEA